ncbi:MAG: radical SAM protein [candidate division KSB1 bacterium]|nr:radical SAM protein [candidate division KSB1 bacterium]
MTITTKSALPRLVVSDGQGQVFDVPELDMVGMSLNEPRIPRDNELIPMPYGSTLFELPGRTALGYDRYRDRIVPLRRYKGKKVIAVAAFMAPAHTQIYRAAYLSTESPVPLLPLFAYTAVGWKEGQFWVTGFRVDSDIRHDPAQFDFSRIEQQAQEVLKKYPRNRLVHHLVTNCVQRSGCPGAYNFVLGRWECPVPTSPGCNARCVGCISRQPEGTVPPTQERLNFVPTIEEILEFTIPHLNQAPRAIISFGQGCEGEPLLQGALLEEAIRTIRKQTSRGTINLNTNGSRPEVVERLCQAGLDSIRVSLNSAQKTYYQRYFEPVDYSFEDVIETIKIVRRYGRWVSLNYFIFPGFTDHPQEMEHLVHLMQKVDIQMIQLRNLNMDPEWYIRQLRLEELPSNSIGILSWRDTLKNQFPALRFGYFNPPKEDWSDGY